LDNIKMDFRNVWCGGMGWIDLTQVRDQWRHLLNMVINFRVPKFAGKFLSSCTTGGLSRRSHLHVVICHHDAASFLIDKYCSESQEIDRSSGGPLPPSKAIHWTTYAYSYCICEKVSEMYIFHWGFQAKCWILSHQPYYMPRPPTPPCFMGLEEGFGGISTVFVTQFRLSSCWIIS
jgi:hypothetical protein